MDVQEEVVTQTRRRLKGAGYGGTRVLCRDGALGAPEGAPYHRVVATVGCPDISWRWVEQLDPEGVMLIPLQHGAPHCHPLVRLSVEDEQHLRGRIAGWSGFMQMQGELAVPQGELWADVVPYDMEEEGPPDQRFPLFPALEGAPLGPEAGESGRWAWFDFHYFLALCDRRAYLGAGSLGLGDPELGVVAATREGVKLWGDEALYRELERIYWRWEELGKPELTDWRVEMFPQAHLEQCQSQK